MGRSREKKKFRGEQMKRIAKDLKMSYKAIDDFGLDTLLMDFQLFQKGRKRVIKNLMRKNDGKVDIRIFDYIYLRGGGKRRRRREQTVMFIHSNQLGLPEFLMKPESILHKIGVKFGFQDINFVDHEKFSNDYLVQGEHEDFVRDLFERKLLRYFTFKGNWSLEGLNYYLIIYKHGKLMKTKDLRAFYDRGLQIFNILKEKSI